MDDPQNENNQLHFEFFWGIINQEIIFTLVSPLIDIFSIEIGKINPSQSYATSVKRIRTHTFSCGLPSKTV